MNPKPQLSLLAGLAVLPVSLLLGSGLGAQDRKPVSAATGEKVTLRVAAPKDTTVWFKTRTNMTQQREVAGQQMDLNFNTELILNAKVLGAAEDGSLTVEVAIAAVRGGMELPQLGEIQFDSTSKEGNDDELGIGKAFVTLAGRKLTATIAPSGKVTRLDGASEAAEAAAADANMMGGQLIKGFISEASLKQNVQRLFGRLAKEPVSLGEAWDGEHDPSSARNPVQTKSRLTLTRLDADQAEITMAGKITKPESAPEAKDKGDKAGGHGEGGDMEEMARAVRNSMKVDNGTLKGRFLVSRKDGMVVESSEETAVDITTSTPMEMSMHQTSKATVERTTADAAKPKPKDEKKDAKGDKGKDEKQEGK